MSRRSVVSTEGGNITQHDCKCGHPAAAHRPGYSGPFDSSGRRTYALRCIATITRRRTDGDDSWPCPCEDFKTKEHEEDEPDPPYGLDFSLWGKTEKEARERIALANAVKRSV